MSRLLIRLVITGISVWAAARLIPGYHLGTDAATLIGVPLVFGLVNALVRPVVTWLSCGLIALTLGLFILVVNALMLLLTTWLAGGLGLDVTVEGFVPALFAALVISIVSFVFSLLVPERD